ncbi:MULTISPECIES: glycosyltransferase family 2 protein [Aerococcus]|uniref:glycosyltransferase family 2 protein n=1 Tax=Aerococcus TaxID=1375 RepID=UPI00227D551B|nr:MULTISPECIES: glycosyltransferase family A protein [Aerococcus]MCY3036068.1 glycosyltransferase family 2 protein [Aerococcus sp. Group 2]MCY3040024.1 glycosyltransferase family 2 protein [Aerococcus sp. Group 2]MCY3040738.1 glycosyltransferase family 2 protein [Aerococcus sp. Group 2]MCY3042730.1 glycosyltransferase family 2 protein [Aerococcus sp. Group 2]MDK6520875.1 glycosyltransferase family A protein [Aerococcus urinae]
MQFSIIMPVYNVENYLERSINSILNQSYKDWELIIVNDGSKDSSKKICEEFANNDNRIKLINQKNQGSGVARAKALENAKGDYIVFVDPDDFTVENSLTAINAIIEKNKEKPDIIFCGYNEIAKNKAGKNITITHRYDNNKLLTEDAIGSSFKIIESVSIKSLWNKVYSRDFLFRNNVNFSDQRVGQDALFNFTAYKYITKIYISTDIIYNYDATREGSAVKTFNPNKHMYEINIADAFKKFVEIQNIPNKDKLILREYWYALFTQILNLSTSTCSWTIEEKTENILDMLNSRHEYRGLKNLDRNSFNGRFEQIIYNLIVRSRIKIALCLSRFYYKTFLEI